MTKIKKIEILNTYAFEKLIEEYEIEKFMCSGDKCNETDNILRIAVYANYDMFDEFAEQLSDSDYGFRIYSMTKNKIKVVLLELF